MPGPVDEGQVQFVSHGVEVGRYQVPRDLLHLPNHVLQRRTKDSYKW